MITGLTALLTLLSLVLIVIVPVALATPGEWEVSKRNIYRAIQVWVAIIVLIASIDGTSKIS